MRAQQLKVRWGSEGARCFNRFTFTLTPHLIPVIDEDIRHERVIKKGLQRTLTTHQGEEFSGRFKRISTSYRHLSGEFMHGHRYSSLDQHLKLATRYISVIILLQQSPRQRY
jgi:hypothetical protein